MKVPTWHSLMRGARMARIGMNMWPPFAFSGIVLDELSDDFRYARVSLRPRVLTRNYVGTLFGGSLFAMTDPFWMILVLHNLGRDYIVWDKAGEIEFVTPGRERVYAEFTLTDDLLDELRAATHDGGKALRWLEVPVVTADGTVVARVRKQLYVRRKASSRQ